jgi:hypothetical protein
MQAMQLVTQQMQQVPQVPALTLQVAGRQLHNQMEPWQQQQQKHHQPPQPLL